MRSTNPAAVTTAVNSLASVLRRLASKLATISSTDVAQLAFSSSSRLRIPKQRLAVSVAVIVVIVASTASTSVLLSPSSILPTLAAIHNSPKCLVMRSTARRAKRGLDTSNEIAKRYTRTARSGLSMASILVARASCSVTRERYAAHFHMSNAVFRSKERPETRVPV